MRIFTGIIFFQDELQYSAFEYKNTPLKRKKPEEEEEEEDEEEEEISLPIKSFTK